MVSPRRNLAVDFAPIRERFARKHTIEQAEPPRQVVWRLTRFAAQNRVEPERLTMITSATGCEFLGVSIDTWRYWLSVAGVTSAIGPLPSPREPGGPHRGRGVSDLWMLELDIVPWLASTPEGLVLLTGVIREIQQGRVHPVLNGRRIVRYETREEVPGG